MPPDLYNALSATSGGFLNQQSQQPAGGPPRSLGVGPSSGGPTSPMSPNGDNMFAPSSQAPLPQPDYRSNPVVTTDNRSAVNQQPNPQPNSSPTMPGMYAAMQKDVGGSPGMPSNTVENSPNMNGQSLYRSIVNP